MVHGRVSNIHTGAHLLNVAMTYPACWDEIELGRLKTAVVKAGVPSPAKYVSEAKAATYGILHEYKTKSRRISRYVCPHAPHTSRGQH